MAGEREAWEEGRPGMSEEQHGSHGSWLEKSTGQWGEQNRNRRRGMEEVW